jgi:transcription initiation factor IIE alpha subunit
MNDFSSENGSSRSNPGLNCPQCGIRIHFSIEALLMNPAVTCTGCGLELTIDRSESRPALDALQKLYEGIREADRIKSESGNK